ncbi:MAG TPA: hypothetical protein PKO15_09015 [Fibrobacteria bacterium]|nr:hypothetical protein [Fibrobacteria bacterium]
MTQRSMLKSFEEVRKHRVFAPIFQEIDQVVELAGRDFFSRPHLDLPARQPLAGHFDLTAAIHRRWILESKKGRRSIRGSWKTMKPLGVDDVPPISSLPPCMNPLSGERCPKKGLPRKAKLVNFRDLAVEIKPVFFQGAVDYQASCKFVRKGSIDRMKTIKLGGRTRFTLAEFVDLPPFKESDFGDGRALQIDVEICNRHVPQSRSRKSLLLTPNTIATPLLSSKPPREWNRPFAGRWG